MKAVIFDLNGVLILDKPGYKSSEFEHNFFKRMGVSMDDKKEKENIKLENNWNEEQFWDFVGQGWNGAIPNMELIQIIKKLRTDGYKTAIISNTSGLIMRKKIDRYFGEKIENLFEEIIISSEVGLLKPDEKIYEMVLKKLGTQPGETIMIDDSDSYLEGARRLGIVCLVFRDNETLRSDLNRLGVAS